MLLYINYNAPKYQTHTETYKRPKLFHITIKRYTSIKMQINLFKSF